MAFPVLECCRLCNTVLAGRWKIFVWIRDIAIHGIGHWRCTRYLLVCVYDHRSVFGYAVLTEDSASFRQGLSVLPDRIATKHHHGQQIFSRCGTFLKVEQRKCGNACIFRDWLCNCGVFKTCEWSVKVVFGWLHSAVLAARRIGVFPMDYSAAGYDALYQLVLPVSDGQTAYEATSGGGKIAHMSYGIYLSHFMLISAFLKLGLFQKLPLCIEPLVMAFSVLITTMLMLWVVVKLGLKKYVM